MVSGPYCWMKAEAGGYRCSMRISLVIGSSAPSFFACNDHSADRQSAVLNVAYELVLADVKTKTSRRTIDLDARTVAVLRAWRKAQLEERMALGRRPDDNGIVFAALEGGPTHPDLFSQIFDRHVAKSTLPRIRLHDLRHTHASILLKAGVPVKVVSERLGHSSPAFTMTVYQHVLPGMQADAARAFSEAVFDRG